MAPSLEWKGQKQKSKHNGVPISRGKNKYRLRRCESIRTPYRTMHLNEAAGGFAGGLYEACMRLVVGKLRKDPLNGPEARRFVSKSNGLLLQNASVGKSDLYKQLPSPAIHSCRRCGAMAFAWAIKIASASSMQVNPAIRRRSRRTSWESLYVHGVYIGIFCNYSNDQPCQIKSGVSLSNHIDIVLATSYVISHTLGNML